MASSSSHDEEKPCPYIKDSASFFRIGNSRQYDHVLRLYPQALRIKAEKRHKKPDKLIRLDDWFQNELPKLIKKRGKDAHLTHEELVQSMEWKQSRGKNYPQLSYLIKVNTPRAVMMETRKAFKKLPNIEQAIIALSNLKGVGTTMASALLAAACPERAPFMADECLMAIPEMEGIDYTTKEYLNFVQHIQSTVNRLNSEHALSQQAAGNGAAATTGDESSDGSDEAKKVDGNDAEPETTKPDDEDEDKKNSTDDDESSDSRKKVDTNGKAAKGVSEADKVPLKWSPHTVELALWTHYIAHELQPELLKDLPGSEQHEDTVLSSKFQKNGDIDQDEETIPDGSEALTSNRVTALIANDKELEEGSSSHDEGAQEVMKLNGDDLTDAVSVPSAVKVSATGTAGNGTVAAVVESGENSSDTGTGTMTTMVNNVSSSESKAGDDEEEEGSSQDEEAFKYKTAAAAGNGDISSTTSPSSTTTPGGTKRFSAEPLTNVMAKCPKLMLDR